jgi:hypothetical protein
MTSVALRADGILGWRSPTVTVRQSVTNTSTWSRVKEPTPSAPASTDETDSRRVIQKSWLQPVMNRLVHLAQLEDGWGGPGTLRIDEGVLRKAYEALARIALIATEKTRPPSISPGQDGSLQLAWYIREFELEIDIPRSGDPTASLYEHESGEETELLLTSPRLYAVIGRLAAD